MSRQQQLVRRLLRVAETMVQGGLSQTSRRCGNPNCICQRDPNRLHGPHLYITFRENNKSCSLYVPPEHANALDQSHMAWAIVWSNGCALAKSNRHRLRKQWRLETKLRV